MATGRRSRPLRVVLLYVAALAREFRGALLVTGALVAVGAALFLNTSHAALGGRRPDAVLAVYAAWMALFAEVVFSPPETWYLDLLHAVYPLVGLVVLGEGIVRFALLMTSRRRGEREWNRVMASTYRDHVVLCGLGHLGLRVLEELRRRGVEVVVVERDAAARFLPAARALGVPVLVADMRDDAVLVEASVRHARTIVVATSDDMANLEVALDARRLNPAIKVMVRFYDQQLAAKVQGAFGIDEAFSSAALAAPVIVDRAVAPPAARG
jgi:hypothetical protein